VALRRLLTALVWTGVIAFGTADRASSANHAIYVGVAEYQFGKPTYARGTFPNLEGAPHDIALIRSALESRHQFEPPEILLDAQASRAAILSTLGQFSSGAKGDSGDSLLFYFTGHGARLVDLAGTQAGRFHSTILPYDARDPVRRRAGIYGDIVDTELNGVIQAIAARGINVITVFDSCNSGTATRSIPFRKWRSKAAPAIVAPTPPVQVEVGTSPTAARQGYVVHLAAAADNSEALENLADGTYRSDFTVALSKAILRAPPGATYREIFEATRLQLVAAGLGQEPRAEGDLLTPFLGASKGGARIIAATRSVRGDYVLAGGTLSGIDRGATFALHRSIRKALDTKARPIALATVRSADAWEARLEVNRREPELYARQQSPSFETARLPVAIRATDEPGRSTLVKRLAPFDFLTITDRDPAYMLDLNDGTVRVVSAYGEIIKTATLDERFTDFMAGLAKYHALLAISEKADPLPIELAFTETDCKGENAAPVGEQGGTPIFRQGDRFHLTLGNRDGTPLHFYLISLGADFSVQLLDPPSQAIAAPLAAGRLCYQPLAARGASMGIPGRHHLLLIASERPLPSLHLLQQEALRAPVTDPLERLLASAASGLRATSPRQAPGRWGAKVITYKVVPRSSQ
jgi:hypothetical protein